MEAIIWIMALTAVFIGLWLWQTWRVDRYVQRMRSRFHWRDENAEETETKAN